MSKMPSARKTVTSVFLASLALSMTPAIAHANPEPAPAIPNIPSPLAPGEQRYIVKYDNDTNAALESESMKKRGLKVKETLSHAVKASVIEASAIEVEKLKKQKNVVSVELDQQISISGSTSLWGLDRIDQRTGTNGQYNVSNEGSGVNAYVVDTGISLQHNEFTGRIPTGWDGIKDGGGLNDCNGHGTHVAGTVAGTTYGVANKASIIPIRAMGCDGKGWGSTVMAGIDWAIDHHVAGQPAVMNLSIGGITSLTFDEAVKNAVKDGITVVAAAGNSNVDACSSAPARIPVAITVAATDSTDTMASFSNYGSCVDVQAPGVNIRSAYPGSTTTYAYLNGTSMASPHVAGAAAVMLSRDSSLSPAQVHDAIVSNSTPDVVKGNKTGTPNKFLFVSGRTISTGKNLEAIDPSGVLWSYNANNGTLANRTQIGGGWGEVKQLLETDWNSDGTPDLVARWSNGYLTMYSGVGNTNGDSKGYNAPITIGHGGWQDFDLNAVKLRNTDKYPGLVARDTVSGNLFYYPNSNGGELTTPRTQIGFGGWVPMNEISAMDWDSNGNMDLIVRNPEGDLKLYRTDGAGNILLEDRPTLDFGWNVMDHVAIEHGFYGDGTVGIIARNTNGYVFYYPISDGKVQSPTIIGHGGWSGYKLAAGTP